MDVVKTASLEISDLFFDFRGINWKTMRQGEEKTPLHILSIWVGFGWWESEDI